MLANAPEPDALQLLTADDAPTALKVPAPTALSIAVVVTPPTEGRVVIGTCERA
ncbi:MAG: hypothetical protein JWR51_4726, partial [Devosia sp.]|nr:hypothetical protein [Devosia sp.]